MTSRMTASHAVPLCVTEHSPAYWTATFDDPPLNLFGPETHAALRLLLDRIEASDELRVVVFDSAVPDFFLAHFDIARGDEVPDIPGAAPISAWPETMARLVAAPVISIAAIRGRARGQGSEFALACDLRFAGDKAVLAQPEVGVGVVPGGGSVQWLPALVGRSRALEIIVGADDFEAATAERYGWINRVVPDAELDAFADAFARRLASFDRAPIAAAKAAINIASVLPVSDQITDNQQTFQHLAATPQTRARISLLFERGLQQPGEVERDFGRHLAGLG